MEKGLYIIRKMEKLSIKVILLMVNMKDLENYMMKMEHCNVKVILKMGNVKKI